MKPLVKRLIAVIAWWTDKVERRRQRRALGQLDKRMLRDIGIRPDDTACEARRPFWR